MTQPLWPWGILNHQPPMNEQPLAHKLQLLDYVHIKSKTNIFMPMPLIGGGIKRCFCLTSVCLSVCRIHRDWVENREAQEDQNCHGDSPRHMWLGHHFQGQRSRSPGRFTQRGLNAYGRCRGQRGHVFGVGKYCYVVFARRRSRSLGAHRGGEGRGILCRHAHSLFTITLEVVNKFPSNLEHSISDKC